MARASIWMDRFDRDADFVVARPFSLSTGEQRPGDKFDKSTLSTRTLRLLYESRKIKVATVANDGERQVLLEQYRQRFGKRPFGGWGNVELRRRLEAT